MVLKKKLVQQHCEFWSSGLRSGASSKLEMVDHGSEIKFHRWKQFNQLPSTLINLISLIRVMSQSIIPLLGIPLKLRKLFKLLEIKSSSVLDIPHTVLKWRQFQVLPNWKRNVFVECHSWYYTNIEVYLESVLTIKSVVWKMSVKFKGPTVGVGPSITSGCGHVLFSISFPGRIFANMAIFIQFAADFSVKKKISSLFNVHCCRVSKKRRVWLRTTETSYQRPSSLYLELLFLSYWFTRF